MKKLYVILYVMLSMLLLISCSKKAGSEQPSGQTGQSSSTTAIPTVPPKITVEPTPTVIPTKAPTVSPTQTITQIPETTPVVNLPDSSALETTAKEILEGMTLEEKIGQLFFVRCRIATGNADVKTYHLGGYILFAEDFKDQTKTSIKKIIKGYQDRSKIPLLIGVDEEGGTVNRISKYPSFRSVPFQSPQELYQKGGFDLIKSDTLEKANLLKSLGINVNLAPVCDVSTNSGDFIYQRSFGKDASATAEYVKAVVTVMSSAKIGSTLKHFPGYGNNVDTHTGIAIDERSYKNFQNSDFLPFEAGISAGAGSILVSHNIVKAMDPDYPASLSPNVHDILRNELGFQGVIMTDDLSMDAIKDYTNDENAAVLAILAGNDLVVASNFDVQIPAVIAAVKDKKITEQRIDASVLRVLLWKLSLGIMK